MIYLNISFRLFKILNKLRFVLSVFFISFLLQFYSSGIKAQTAFWVESINNQARKIGVTAIPISGAGATNIASANIPLFIFTDTRNNLVYWSDVGTGTIKKVNESGGTVTDVVTGILGSGVYPRGIYLDITNNLLYWSETSPGVTDVIKKIDISGALPKAASSGTIIVSDIDIVRGVTVDTIANQIYFADAGSGGSGNGIYRANLTAPPVLESAATKLVATTGQPNSLFIDRTNNFIYWANYSNPGGNIQRVLTNSGSYPIAPSDVFTGVSIRGISIDIPTNSIYWIEPLNLKIKKASLATVPITVSADVVTSLNNFPRDLSIANLAISPDYFRTRQSGNWNDVNTWESSPVADFSSGVVSPAAVTPDFNSNVITIRSPHTVTITANLTTDQTVINSGGAIIVNPTIIVTINDGTGTDVTVNSGGNFTLKSTAVGTASIGNSGGTTLGNFTIERYIPARRAWRFLSAPLSSVSAPTINASWQEGVTTASINPNPGFGTHITGGSTANGFDQNSRNNSSLKIYNNATSAIDQNNWIGIATTLTPITGQQGYMLFVRGSRANNLSQGTSAVADNTTLRMTGAINSGNQNVSIGATGFTVVGNPYASPINLNALAKTNGSTNVADNFYVWDPKMAGTFGVGAYVNILWNTGTSSYDITPSPVSPVSQYIQSGEAFFATSTGSAGNLIIKETDKTASGSDNVFRVISGNDQKIRTNLYAINADGTTSILDGTLNSYNSIFSDVIDKDDAAKLTNFGENIATIREGKTFIVERRNAIGDNINLKIWQMNQQTYLLQIVTENLAAYVTAYLQDSYLKINTPLNISGTTAINFSITSDAASAAENRFAIVFGKPAVTAPGSSNIMVYPNPVTNGIINVRFDNMPQGNYLIKIVNNLGQTVLSKTINHLQATNIEKLQINKKGIYHIEITKPDNTKYTTKVIAN
jgi:hypothetical protein